MARPRTHADNAARQRAYRQRKRAGRPVKLTQREAAQLMSVSVRSLQRVARILRWRDACAQVAPDIAKEIDAMLQAVDAGIGLPVRTIELRCESLASIASGRLATKGDES